MNIYELNNLITSIENPKHAGHDLLDFYLNMRVELMKTLSSGIQNILDESFKEVY